MPTYPMPTPGADGAVPSSREIRTGQVVPAGRDGQGGRVDSLGDGRDPRLAALAASLSARLGPVCRDWDPAEFRALVERIARTQLRWAERDGVA